MTFVLDEWLGEWTSFETLIDSDDPHLNRAWEESDAALRGGKSPFRYILPFFGGSARRFWGWACRTAGREHRARIGGWRITPLPTADDAAPSSISTTCGRFGAAVETPDLASDDDADIVSGAKPGIVSGQPAKPAPYDGTIGHHPDAPSSDTDVSCETTHETLRQATDHGDVTEPAEVPQGFALAWFGADGEPIGRHDYRLDHTIDKGLEGKPCYVFHATDAPAGQRDPFAVLIAMDPMPSRAELADGGLLSHLHFQYASAESKLLKGEGRTARLRHRMWYPTMCAAEGDLLAQCNIVRALHQLPVWTELPR